MCFAFVYTLNERQLVRNRHYSSLLPRLLLLLSVHFCLLRVSFIHEVNIKQQKIIMTQHVNWGKQNWVRSLETARARVREGDWSETLSSMANMCICANLAVEECVHVCVQKYLRNELDKCMNVNVFDFLETLMGSLIIFIAMKSLTKYFWERNYFFYCYRFYLIGIF